MTPLIILLVATVLLLALFPANVYAAINAIQFRGSPPTDVWLRALIQLVLLGALWWSTVSVRRE